MGIGSTSQSRWVLSNQTCLESQSNSLKIFSLVYFAIHDDLVQIVVETNNGELLDRLSPWANYVVQPPVNEGFAYHQVVWHPPKVIVFLFFLFFL